MLSIARAFAFSLFTMAWAFTSVAQTESQLHPFSEKPLARPHIYVESLSLFRPWLGGEVPLGAYDSAAFKRFRLGTISLAANVQVHIDALENAVHFPSYFELIDARTGLLLGSYPVLSIEDADWYFNGNGSVYLNQRHLSLCGPRYTRKFSATAKAITEASQPILYIGSETEALKVTPLYESPSSKAIVATVLPNTKVVVIGLFSGLSHAATPPLLVKTPFGLTGWHCNGEWIGAGIGISALAVILPGAGLFHGIPLGHRIAIVPRGAQSCELVDPGVAMLRATRDRKIDGPRVAIRVIGDDIAVLAVGVVYRASAISRVHPFFIVVRVLVRCIHGFNEHGPHMAVAIIGGAHHRIVVDGHPITFAVLNTASIGSAIQ